MDVPLHSLDTPRDDEYGSKVMVVVNDRRLWRWRAMNLVIGSRRTMEALKDKPGCTERPTKTLAGRKHHQPLLSLRRSAPQRTWAIRYVIPRRRFCLLQLIVHNAG